MMFNFLTPFRRDLIAITGGALALALSLYFWPLTALTVLSFLAAFVLAAQVAFYFYIHPGTFIWNEFKAIFTNDASRELMRLAEKNTLTVDKAKWLLQAGIFRNKADFVGGLDPLGSEKDDRTTVLHWAAHHGRQDLVEYLLGEGANPRAQGLCIGTPFHVAVTRNHPELLKLLYVDKQQLNQKICGHLHLTPIDYAASKGYTVLFKELDDGFAVLNTIEEKFCALAHAIREDHVDILKVYAKKCESQADGGTLLTLKKDGSNLLHVAASWNSCNCLNSLLEKATIEDFNLRNSDNLIPADVAYIFSSSACLALFNRFLAHQGASLSFSDELGKKKAAYEDNKKIIFSTLKGLRPSPINKEHPLCGAEIEATTTQRAGQQQRM